MALTLLSIRAGAQNGADAPTIRTIRGTVLDATTRKPVVAAQIRPSGSNAAVFTEADGTFVIEGVAAGPVRLDIDEPGYARRSLDVPDDEDTIDVSLAPSPDEPIVITGTACHLSQPLPREIHRWELLSGFRVGGGLDSRDHGGSVFDLGLRAEVTYAASSWRSPFRIGPFVALASTNVGSLEPMAGLTSYWGKQRILDTGRYLGSGAWVVSMSGGYALRRDSMGQDAPVASVEARRRAPRELAGHGNGERTAWPEDARPEQVVDSGAEVKQAPDGTRQTFTAWSAVPDVPRPGSAQVGRVPTLPDSLSGANQCSRTGAPHARTPMPRRR